MAANAGATAVKTLQVNKSRLQETLSSNLEKHKKEFAEARRGYEAARLDLMRKLGEAVAICRSENTSEHRKAIYESYQEFARLDTPQNHSESYVQAIALMEWEERDSIELSINDFESYVRDNWNWSGSFKTAYTNYSAHSH